MSERLVILSDLWGPRKGLWITSYLGYLQQYFDITYYDTSQLADLEVSHPTTKTLTDAFLKGGMERAVKSLLHKERKPSNYLTFCSGGTVVWNAVKKGLPVKSLYAISPMNLHREATGPDCPVKTFYGEYMEDKPSKKWAKLTGTTMEIIPRFGREMYSDEKVIQQVCKELLEETLRKQYQGL
jgi:hypothetical protein